MKLRYRCATNRRIALPRYSDARGWTRGTPGVLYAFVDNRTGRVTVTGHPDARRHSIGPEVSVRVATRGEADAAEYGLDARGQSKGSGWIVACSPKRRK